MLHGLLFGVMGLVLLFYHKLAASRCKYFVITRTRLAGYTPYILHILQYATLH